MSRKNSNDFEPMMKKKSESMVSGDRKSEYDLASSYDENHSGKGLYQGRNPDDSDVFSDNESSQNSLGESTADQQKDSPNEDSMSWFKCTQCFLFESFDQNSQQFIEVIPSYSI